MYYYRSKSIDLIDFLDRKYYIKIKFGDYNFQVDSVYEDEGINNSGIRKSRVINGGKK